MIISLNMFYGRFSATNDSNLTSQISKTIEYEKYLFPDPAFPWSAMLISTGMMEMAMITEMDKLII